ncbi:hypothetical protein BGZ76_007598 [Entomortierella beljakovae]|nr:hypothetical protein BGZ76_007598 [Entomortierella beljakovae]
MDSSYFRPLNPLARCRMLLYKGRQPIQLAHLLTKPERSIINQYFDSREPLDSRRYINGDGFGVGWYESQPDSELDVAPCIFTSVTPAWNNMNLLRLADKIKSPLVFAHIKRKVQESLSDELYLSVNGNTDSEWAFAVFLSQLETPRQSEPFSYNELQEAMLKTIRKLNTWCNEARAVKNTKDHSHFPDNDDDRHHDSKEDLSTLNFAVTDGVSIVCTRYINSRHHEPIHLYFSSGSKFECTQPGRYRMVKESAKREDIIVFASEPLTLEETEWREVPRNSLVVVTARMNILIFPIEEENQNPCPIAVVNEGKLEVESKVESALSDDTSDGIVTEEVVNSISISEAKFFKKGPVAEAIEINHQNLTRQTARSRMGSNDDSYGAETLNPVSPSMFSNPSLHPLESSPSSPSSVNSDMSHLNEDIMTLAGVFRRSDSLEMNGGIGGHFQGGHYKISECNVNDEDEDSEIEEDFRIFPARSSISKWRSNGLNKI